MIFLAALTSQETGWIVGGGVLLAVVLGSILIIVVVAPSLLELGLARPRRMAVQMGLLQGDQDADVVVDRLVAREPRAQEVPYHRRHLWKRKNDNVYNRYILV